MPAVEADLLKDDAAGPTVPRAGFAETAVNAPQATSFLKALSHEGRLMILCHLATGEKSVTELEELLGARQAAVSQQLARLRIEGLVTARRDGKSIFYSILDHRVESAVQLICQLFHDPD